MTNGEIIEQLENAIELIKQDGKDWLDDRDIPILEACIKSLTALDKIRAEIDSHCSDNRDRNDGLYIAMKIIDKYIQNTCDRCGKVIDHYGLCEECDKWLEDNYGEGKKNV